MGNRVHLKSGTRSDYDQLYTGDDGPDQFSLYFVNTNGVFDPHGLIDDGDLYLGGALIGVSRAEKEQTDSSIYAIEQLLSQIQTIDSSSWYIGNDSSAMVGWIKKAITGAKTDYQRDVSIGSLIYSDKLDISISLTLENWSGYGYDAQISTEIGYEVPPIGIGTPDWVSVGAFSTQVKMSYVPTKNSQYWTTNVHLSGLIYGPFYPSEHEYKLKTHIIIPSENTIVARATTPESNLPNASQIIVRGYRSAI